MFGSERAFSDAVRFLTATALLSVDNHVQDVSSFGGEFKWFRIVYSYGRAVLLKA